MRKGSVSVDDMFCAERERNPVYRVCSYLKKSCKRLLTEKAARDILAVRGGSDMEPNGKGAERLDQDVERREAERKRREREAIAEMSGEPAEEPRENADPQEEA